MSKHLFSTILGAVATVFAVNAASAQPADIEPKVQVCSACHGANGMPLDPKTMPIIWGQTEYYIFKQLLDYRSGARENPIMSGIAKTLQQQDLRPIGKYFAAKTWPAKQAAANNPAPAKMENCMICHQAHLEGGQPAPRLAGLSYEYLIAQMNAFANDTRTNNGDMPAIMKALSAGEREAIARYAAGL
jgi:cytochrome c553